jgi:hypothetical protein
MPVRKPSKGTATETEEPLLMPKFQPLTKEQLQTGGREEPEGIAVAIHHSRFRLNTPAMRALGFPERIAFLHDEETRTLGIVAGKSDSDIYTVKINNKKPFTAQTLRVFKLYDIQAPISRWHTTRLGDYN